MSVFQMFRFACSVDIQGTVFNERLEEESVETHQFVLDLRNMIELTSKMARGHLNFFSEQV